MKLNMREREDIDKYIYNKELVANTYVMRCYFISMIVYSCCCLLNVLDFFAIDNRIFFAGYIPSIIIFLIVIFVAKKITLKVKQMKYFILFCIILMHTIISATITYHVEIIAILPFLYAVLYSSKKVMLYVYGLTVVSTISSVYVGYYYGLCDANMVLLTNTSINNYLVDGFFKLTEVNPNPAIYIMIYFIIPRCIIYIAFIVVCGSIFRIITAGIQKAEDAIKLEVFQRELKSKVDEQTVELREQQKKIEEAYLQIVTALSEAVDAKDRYTSGHSKRVAQYSKMIAKRMGKSDSEQENIYRAGLLHDVGKIRIPGDIINKPSKLTDEEYELIKLHSVTGYHILKNISDNKEMAIAAKYHHERYDGKGYPNGLAGEEIPEVSRILAVADSYDAMTSNRSYRKGLPQDVVKGEIEKGRGTQFDAHIADIMLQMIDEDKEYRLRQIDKNLYKILMVGDSTECNQRVKDIIQQESVYVVDVLDTATVESMSKKLEEQDFELIIFDISADNIDEWKNIRTIKDKYHIPIIIMSDDKNLRSKKEFKEFGCDDYFTKPFTAVMLNEIIYNMIKKSI